MYLHPFYNLTAHQMLSISWQCCKMIQQKLLKLLAFHYQYGLKVGRLATNIINAIFVSSH